MKIKKIYLINGIVVLLIILNIYFSFRAVKECMYDYLENCSKYGICEGKIYDLKYYNDGISIWHIVHINNDTLKNDKNIEKMKNNGVKGCLFMTDDMLLNVSGTIQCVDVWLYMKVK